MLEPGTFLWEKYVQHLLRPVVGGASQPVKSEEEEPRAWEREARNLRECWRNQGFEHHDAHPWTEVPHSPPLLRGLSRNSRIAELVDLGYLWASKKRGLTPSSVQDRPRIAANLFIDVAQNPGHRPWSFGLHRVTRNSQIYSYEHDRVISAFEAFRIYGWRNPCLEGLASSEAWDLLGDSMALQTLAVAVSGLLLGAGWHMPGVWEAQS